MGQGVEMNEKWKLMEVGIQNLFYLQVVLFYRYNHPFLKQRG